MPSKRASASGATLPADTLTPSSARSTRGRSVPSNPRVNARRKEFLMSQQDVQTVRSAYDAFNRQDIPAVLATYDDAIEWTEAGGGRAPAGTFRGPEAVARQYSQRFQRISKSFAPLLNSSSTLAIMWLSSDASRVRRRAATLDAPFVHVHGSGMARSQTLQTMSRRLPGPKLGRERSVLVIPYRSSTQGASGCVARTQYRPRMIPG